MSSDSGQRQLQVEVKEEFKGDDTTCGVGPCRPAWLSRFSGPKSFAFCFSAMAVIQSSEWTYYIGVMSTLEKRFAYEAKISAIIMIAAEVGPVLISWLVGYFSRRTNRAHLVAWGMLLISIASFLRGMPYFVFGAAPDQLLSRAGNVSNIQFCSANDSTNPGNTSQVESLGNECTKSRSEQTQVAVILIFIGTLIRGFGGTVVYTVGVPFIDDNIKKKNSPLYHGIVNSVRLFGPMAGLLLSSACLRYYEDLSDPPEFGINDPRWIGAWWLGFVILGALSLIVTLPFFLFPGTLPSSYTERKPQNIASKPTFKDLPKAFKRLFSNTLLMCHVFASSLIIIGIVGYFMINPRYMEVTFRISAADASLYTGPVAIVGTQLGIMAGGIAMQIFRPRPRWFTLYDVFTDVMAVATMLACMLMACPPTRHSGTMQENSLQLLNHCNVGCGCTQEVFSPYCDETEMANYFSPCHAGCGDYSSRALLNCSCLARDNGHFSEGHLKEGHCEGTCHWMVWYLVVLTFGKFMESSSKAGSLLVALRSVNPEDKAFMMGLVDFLMCFFAFGPNPLIFSALTDASCLLWEEKCGVRGNCWVYDVDKLRYYLHGGAMVFLVLGAIAHFGVFLLSHRLRDFYEDEEDEL